MGFTLRAAACVAALACALLAGCGKKGPPLTPIVRVPAAVASLAARRVGDDVFITLTVPDENLDGTMPASVQRVEIYAATSLTPPPRARFFEIATLVATVPVAPAADPGDPSAPVPAIEPGSAAPQGTMVTVRDALSPDELTPRELPASPDERRAPAVPIPATGANTPVLRRFYMAMAVSARGQGPPSPIAELPLALTVPAPGTLRGVVPASAMTLTWEPSGGIVGWLLDRGLALESAPFPDLVLPPSAAAAALAALALPPGPTLYNVYRHLAADPLAAPAATAPAADWNAEPAVPLNAAPLAALTFTDPIVSDERQRCYEVRALRGAGAQRVESAASHAVCATPYDIEPPAPPAELRSIAAEGEISLFWEPNIEDDLGGYIVLRGSPGSDTLQTLTMAPIRETRFTDRGVVPGVRYTYFVRAVDSRIPLPNVSDATQVAETAR